MHTTENHCTLCFMPLINSSIRKLKHTVFLLLIMYWNINKTKWKKENFWQQSNKTCRFKVLPRQARLRRVIFWKNRYNDWKNSDKWLVDFNPLFLIGRANFDWWKSKKQWILNMSCFRVCLSFRYKEDTCSVQVIVPVYHCMRVLVRTGDIS